MVESKMYRRIQDLKKRGYGKLAIGRNLKVDPATIRKYYAMSAEEYREYRIETLTREKLFDDFKDEILSVHESNDYRKLNMSGVYDYLEEKFIKLPAGEKSLRNYIHFLEVTGELKYQSKARLYRRVPELPYGKQMQLDFGEYKLKSGLKLYIFALVLSGSRYKYIVFQDTPFKTIDVILHLLDAFDYFGGYAFELVIDQDSLMVANENYGEIVYTKQFASFTEEMVIKMYVCRKADPESKGKIENVIKYVKNNFLSLRDFETVEQANESVGKWLRRRANGKISQASKKVPSLAIEEERKYLKPLKNSIYRKITHLGREERTVSEKSYIMAEGKEYSVPIEYRAKKVEFYKTDDEIFIFENRTGKEIARHKIPDGAKKVSKRDHFRYKSFPLNELEEKVILLFDDERWKSFVENTRKAFLRYRRDQYTLALRRFTKIEETGIFRRAVAYCLENKTYGMKKLHDTYQYLLKEHRQKQQIVLGLFSETPRPINRASSVNVSKRSVELYEALIGSNGKAAV
ncbi:MAG: transposase for insertion sequence element IS21-like protein [bacterium]|nr:MAG: transposase for insertion sequence element IS21-like protein [bacterium]